MKQKFAWILGVLIVLSLLATSFVSARPQADDLMVSHFFTIPEGSKHSSYNGDPVSSDCTISLTEGWTTNLPYNTCAVAVRFAYKDNTATHYGTLRPTADDGYALVARTQVANVWSDTAGIVPINTYPPTMFLDLSSAGNVDILITGYWLCAEYYPTPRPTLTPGG